MLIMQRGTIGMKLSSGEMVLTRTGRQTTPFPKLALDTHRKVINTLRKVDAWLLENAILEAEANKDKFNLCWLKQENVKNLPPASKDAMELYLFSDD